MKMSKRATATVLCAALMASMMGACSSTPAETEKDTPPANSAATAEGAEAKGEGATEFTDRVPLYVTAFVSKAEGDGRRSDPVSKYIEDTLNIDLELTGITESDYPSQLSAMIASQDLPDVFLFSDVTKQFPMMTASKSILALDPYLDQYAAKTLADKNGKAMMEAYRTPANSPDGQLYMWGMVKGSFDDGTVPTCGHYLQWDVYKKAGYPELKSYDEDLLNVLEAMVKAEPETANGEKTYGCGAWFGDGQGWGEWVLTFGLAPQEGANLIETTGRTLGVSTVDSKPLPNNQLTDPEGYFWRAAQFYNRANQRGLLDPDSFTQKSDIYEEKVKSGRYMFNVPGWMSVGANKEFDKADGNLKTFISMPSIQADSEDRFGNMFKGERTYGVSANTEYPERAVALLDLVSTYEFSQMAYNGMEGENWTVEDGKPTPTDDFLKQTLDDNYGIQTGVNVYHHFLGYGNGSINPETGTAVDLYQYSEKAVEAKQNDTMKDFISHFKQESQVDVYKTETTNTTAQNYLLFGEAPQDLKTYINNLNAYVGKNISKVIAAKDDAEFAKLQNELIAGMAEFKVDEIFKHFYDEAVAQEEQVANISDMLK